LLRAIASDNIYKCIVCIIFDDLKISLNRVFRIFVL
jgi:hypothetical protein